MRGQAAPFMDDCELAVEYATQHRIINGNGLQAEKDAASARVQELRQHFGGLLRFRCWTVEGQQSYADEDTLCQKLFDNVQGMTTRDHLELFRVWAGRFSVVSNGYKTECDDRATPKITGR